MAKHRTSLQIVDTSSDKPKHVTRLYTDLPADQLLPKLQRALFGHLVSGKNGLESAQIAAENDVQAKSRGEEEENDLVDDDDQAEEEPKHKKKKKH
jgi:hypothetical protein